MSKSNKVKFRQASNCRNMVLETAKLSYANKTNKSITSLKLGSQDFWRIVNSVLNKGKPAIYTSPIQQARGVAYDKAKLFAKKSSKNSHLDGLGISLPVFPSITYLKLHNISVTPKTVKKVITNLDCSKASGSVIF